MCWASVSRLFSTVPQARAPVTQPVERARVQRRPCGCVSGRARPAGVPSRFAADALHRARARRSCICRRNMARRPTPAASKLLSGQARRCAARRRCVTCTHKRVHLFLHVHARHAARRPIFCVARAPLRFAQLTQLHQAADDAERRVGLGLRLCWQHQPRPACGRARQNPGCSLARLFHCCGRRAPARVRGQPRKKRRPEQEQTA